MIDARAAAPHITPYDRLAWSDRAVETLLARGRHPEELTAWFGTRDYAELSALARRAAIAERRQRREREPVYVLPGIMGSQLGIPRGFGLIRDLLWIDPIDIALGRLRELVLRPHSPIRPMGVLLYSYLALKLRLKIAGFAPQFHDYDWRRGVGELGTALAERLVRDPAPRVHLVAHSMGGLVARAALSLPGTERVARLVMLGTPNLGSYSPVLALRGTYSVVRKLAALDLVHSAETLASEVFGGFPSLYDMLPAEGVSALDLFDAQVWPAQGPRPRTALLDAARSTHRGLAPADARMTVIAGHSRPTVVGLTRQGADFEYTVTHAGDGTVPLLHAELPGVATYHTAEGHSELPRSARVAAATIDLLRTGATHRLPTTRPAATRQVARVTDRALRATFNTKVDWHALSPDARRVYLDRLNEPPPLEFRSVGSRPRRRRASRARARMRDRPILELHLVRTSIERVRADAVAVAAFAGVRPAGAAAALDAQLDGAISVAAQRRALGDRAGEIATFMAAGRLAHAGQVLVVSLGRFADLDAGTIEFAAESVARHCAHAQLDAVATVPWGAGAGIPASVSFAAQLRGFLRHAAGSARAPLRIVFCVRDARVHRAVADLAENLVREVDPLGELISLRITPTRPAPRSRRRPRAKAERPALAHVLIERAGADAASETWRAAVLTAGRHATVVTEDTAFDRQRLDTLLRDLDKDRLGPAAAMRVGARLGDLLLHENVRAALELGRDDPLVLVHDAATSRVPWELLTLGSWSPALRAGLSRRFAAADLSVARFSDRRRADEALTVLLLEDPTQDLAGARREGARLRAMFREFPAARLTTVAGRAVTRARVLAEFESGDYDVVHYAGHAAFDPTAPAVGGLTASDGTVTGRDLAGLAQLPTLVFFNACESARVRGARRGAARAEALAQGTSVAEACLRAGVANFVGTWWPVGDAAAETCAATFYRALLAGEALGPALLAARRAVYTSHSPDWANYLHYGDPFFELKAAL